MPEPSGYIVLSYAELAERLGIGPDSARMRAKRKGWMTVPGNDGRTRVHVPPNELPEHPPERPERDADAGEQGAQLAELRAELTEERARAEGALLEAAELRAETRLIREMLERDRADLARERDRGDRLEAALAEARRPLLLRLVDGLRRKG